MNNENNNCTNCQSFVPMDGNYKKNCGLCQFWNTPVNYTMLCPKFKKKGE